MASKPTDLAHESKTKGGWIGIDLGTSNCTAAVWDLSRSRCKVLRLGYQDLARPPPTDSDNRKGGKIVPSAVLFRECTNENGNRGELPSQRITVAGPSHSVGYAATKSFNDASNDNGTTANETNSAALVTSFKRVVGMTSRQAKELKTSDPEFWNSLPFQSVILETDQDDLKNQGQNMHHKQTDGNSDHLNSSFADVLGDNTINTANSIQSSNRPQSQQNHIKEGVAIRVHPLNGTKPSSEQLVTPLQVTTILLQSIRLAASDYLTNKNRRSKIQAPGSEDTSHVQNCIIGVPAHYSHAQRTAIQNAAKNAGFTGHVGVMTESTAASMAYGLFVSPTVSGSDNAPKSELVASKKNILVFDMGGGTTDVTIASIDFGKSSDKVQFRVIATAGDSCLGGDNVDELLARYLWKRQSESPNSELDMGSTWKASEHQDFIRQCRCAKESLCGNDEDDSISGGTAVTETNVTVFGKEIRITRQEFDTSIQPLIDRAEKVVDDALETLESNNPSSRIHEVVLVGGSTHIPTIRLMLRRKFPPPIPPELCTSISAETAVAQGLAIQAALISGTVPLWELRNAMMLDVLPHSIGVWVNNDTGTGNATKFTKGQIIEPSKNARNRGHYVPILIKDDPLPARGSATFSLAAKDQSGVTVIAVEQIGPGEVYQCMGTFDFLLHRLDQNNNGFDVRDIKIGMTLETSGKFIVSVFDENDPEHREKRRRYLKEKALQEGDDDERILEHEVEPFYNDEEEKRQSCSGTEIGLIFFCIIVFSLYVAVRVAFSNGELLVPDMNDEL